MPVTSFVSIMHHFSAPHNETPFSRQIVFLKYFIDKSSPFTVIFSQFEREKSNLASPVSEPGAVEARQATASVKPASRKSFRTDSKKDRTPALKGKQEAMAFAMATSVVPRNVVSGRWRFCFQEV